MKLWSAAASDESPLATFLGRHAFTDVDHHRKEHTFATGGPTLLIWDTARSDPVQSFEWGADSVTRVRFNPAEHSLIGALSNDRSVTLYDLRTGSATQKAVMQVCAPPPRVTTAARNHRVTTAHPPRNHRVTTA